MKTDDGEPPLKSSLDRFIADLPIIEWYPSETLKSSLDRFIGKAEEVQRIKQEPLKSSLDRFIVKFEPCKIRRENL